MEQYKMTDTDHVYSNGTEYVPIYRMRQWFEHCRNQQRPVRHGRWIMGTGENGLQAGHRKCSRCGEIVKYGYSLYGVHNFCNYCGADMRGSNDEKVREDKHEAL